MKIYISGISGTGMGPLALVAHDAGHEVVGTDIAKGAIYDELARAGIEVKIGAQDGEYLKSQIEDVDWYVYTSAVQEGHPELMLAWEWQKTHSGFRISKRDDFTEYLIESLGLKLVAVAGTHGKTTTTSMIIWTCLKLGLPIAYLAGTTLGFASSGAWHEGDKFFVYEADEYDRNFLRYHPWLAVIPVATYDHADIYADEAEYQAAFEKFQNQSEKVLRKGGKLLWKNLEPLRVWPDAFRLAGKVRRADASLAAMAVYEMARELSVGEGSVYADGTHGFVMKDGREIAAEDIIAVLNEFPGVGRRFEKLAEGFYTDYAHHPEEVEATIAVAKMQALMDGRKGVVVVYEPHQNARQYAVRDGYREVFEKAKRTYWVPTYLVRGEKEAAERGELAILTPAELVAGLSEKTKAEVTKLDDRLFWILRKWRDDGYLVLLMTAGPGDAWLREKLAEAGE